MDIRFTLTSHFDKVRRVRNAIEEMEHNPLLFFLLCLNDKDEITDLIKREIKARDFFFEF